MLTVFVKGEEVDSILLGSQLPSWRLDLVLSLNCKWVLKIVTKLLLEVLIVCRFLVFKNIVAVLIIELIYLLGLPKNIRNTTSGN